MKQEDKEWLLKDLCARLPYGVMCKWYGDGVTGIGKLDSVCKMKTSAGFEYWDCYFEDDGDDIPIEIVKPFLRSMSSMTQEEIEKYRQLCETDDGDFTGEPLYFNTCESFDYLNSIHVDYRNFIQRGLALEAPKDMYK